MTRDGRVELSDVATLPRDVASARNELERLLASRWSGDVDLALIAVHEALINADRHGAGIRQALVRVDGEQLTVEVADYGVGFDHRPYVRNAPDLLAERGRGLWLIHQIAADFVLRREPEGSRVLLRFDPSATTGAIEDAAESPPLPDIDQVVAALISSYGAAVALVDRDLVIRQTWGDVEELLNIPRERTVDRDARGLTTELKSRFQDPQRYEQRILDDYAQPTKASEDTFVRRDGRIVRRQSMPFSDGEHLWRVISYSPVAEQTQVVAEVQRSLLPELPDWDDLEIAAIYHPAEASAFVGGDFYDFIQLSSGARCLVVGDVSGRGPAAAATSTHVRAYLRAALRSHGVTGAVSDLDATLSEEFAPEQFVTLALAVQESGDVWTHTNCGHVPALLLRGGQVHEYGGRGGALGMGLPAEWPREPFVLEHGDVLLLFTDGVVDAGSGRRRFGDERLHETLRELHGQSPQQIVRTIDERIHSWAGSHLGDDHIVVAVRRR